MVCIAVLFFPSLIQEGREQRVLHNCEILFLRLTTSEAWYSRSPFTVSSIKDEFEHYDTIILSSTFNQTKHVSVPFSAHSCS